MLQAMHTGVLFVYLLQSFLLPSFLNKKTVAFVNDGILSLEKIIKV